MIDARSEFIVKICSNFISEDAQKILRIYDSVMGRYEITPKCTDIVPISVMEQNERTLKFFMAAKAIEGQSKAALTNNGRFLIKMFRMVGKPIGEYNVNDVRDFLFTYQKQNGVSDRTLAHLRTVVSSFFVWCNNEDIISKNPCKNIGKIKYDVTKREYLTQLELEKMRPLCTDKRNRAMLEVMYTTGCREFELVALKRTDINFETKEIRLFGKNRKERKGYMNARAEIALKAYLAERTDSNPYIFVSKKSVYTNKPMSKSAVYKMVVDLKNAAGITKKISPHNLRHTFGQHAINAGMPIQQVSSLMGHGDIKTTMEYIKDVDGDIKAELLKRVV